MRLKHIAACAVAVAAAGTTSLLTTGAAADAAAPAPLTKVEKMSKATGKTKVTQFVDADGDVVAQAVTELDTTVTLVRDSTGAVVGMDAVPTDPLTEENAMRMARELTPDVIDERRKGVWRASELTDLPPQAGQGGTANRTAPFTMATPGASVSASNPALVFKTGCLKIDAEETWSRACYQRQNVPTGEDGVRKVMDSSFSSGHHKGTWGALRWIKTRHSYLDGHPTTTVIQWKPTVDIPRSSCATFTLSLMHEGVGAAADTTLCDDKESLSIDDQWFMHGWFGALRDDGAWTGSVGHSVPRVRKGESMGFKFGIRNCEEDVSGCEIDGAGA